MKNTLVNSELEHTCAIGMHVYDVENAHSFFSYREREQRVAASSIKLFFAGAVVQNVKKTGLSLSDTLTVREDALVHGASIVADMHTRELSILDLLYFLLAHSDTSAQNVLETIISPDEVNEYIRNEGFEDTLFVSNHTSTKEHLSLTSPFDTVTYMQKLWNGNLLTAPDRELVLSFLARSRMTHFGLRHLPTSLTVKDPSITERYSKAGKVHDSVNDTLLVRTEKGTLAMSIFVDNFVVTENRNSVDHPGILLIAKLAREVFDAWYTPKPQ